MRQKSKGFDFKQFSVQHDRCAMKVGTDAVLLGAWVDIGKATRILDIGTGSGIVALMLAQRTSPTVLIDALEPDEEAANQAHANVIVSPWMKKIIVHQKKLQQFHSDHKFDLIVCNPPYFINSYLPTQSNRKLARHSDSLSHIELIKHSSDLLDQHGKLAVILPYTEGDIFLKIALDNKFYCNRMLSVFTRKDKKQERWIFELSDTESKPSEEKLTIHEGTDNQWSESYKGLTKDFYLYL